MPTAPSARAFAQVDVFTSVPYQGNPVAVVIDADGLDDAAMAAFARWTNLSETTFVLPPTDPGADYLLRIFTPGGELPFAGHPTLGSAHAWLAAGGVPRTPGVLVQQCGAGLVPLRRDGSRLAFAAPPLRRSGPLDDATLAGIAAGLGVAPHEVVAHQWVDNGPGWAAVLLPSAAQVLALEPDWDLLAGRCVGAAAVEPMGAAPELVVRAFAVGVGVREDPVTGSLNAGLAQWLIGSGRMPGRYTARQGARLRRDGRVTVEADGEQIWVGGECVSCIRGTVEI